jgi:uncharacterized protein YkwD/uncharacterized membrane protein required for colicin V production
MMPNWIDAVILLVVGFYTYQGWQSGLVYILSTFASFIVAFWLAIRIHQPVGVFISQKFGIAAGWAKVFAYIAIALGVEAFISEIAVLGIKRLPQKISSSRANKWLGAVVSALNGLIIVAFFLVLILVLPLRGTIKEDIRGSILGASLVNVTKQYAGDTTGWLDEIGKQARRFITVAPTSEERLPLDVSPDAGDLMEDPAAEAQLLELLNAERKKAGLSTVALENKITGVARAHGRDMFMRRYFSHVSPEGKDAGDRLTEGQVQYTLAGENLAYSPDVVTAHQGLMESESHKKNILEPNFKKVGIGIITTKSYGMMVVQDFTD